jgi:hypothetical protein
MLRQSIVDAMETSSKSKKNGKQFTVWWVRLRETPLLGEAWVENPFLP